MHPWEQNTAQKMRKEEKGKAKKNHEINKYKD